MSDLDPISAAGIVITLAAIFAYCNERWLQLPETIGLMVVAMILSLLLVVAGLLNPQVVDFAKTFMQQIDFNETLRAILTVCLYDDGCAGVSLDTGNVSRCK